MKVCRVRNRVYENGSRSRVKVHAEYGVIDGQQVVARIKRNGNSWVAFERSDEQRLGLPVSPMNLRLLRDLKSWALERWGNGR